MIDFLNYLNDNKFIYGDSKTKLYNANHTSSVHNTLKYCLETEKEILSQYQILPLWSNEYYEVMQSDIKNLTINALKYYDFRTTFIKHVEKLEPTD